MDVRALYEHLNSGIDEGSESALTSLSPCRRNAELFKEIIGAHSLAQLPIMKGGMTYPLRLPSIAAWAYLTVKGKMGMGWRDDTPVRFLTTLADYVRDLAESREVREYPGYDYPRLKRMIDRFYAGEPGEAIAINWWLSFESWRRSLCRLDRPATAEMASAHTA